MEELRNKLLDWAKQFETPDFIKDDPIFFPHKYSDKKDIEISAFLTYWSVILHASVFVCFYGG